MSKVASTSTIWQDRVGILDESMIGKRNAWELSKSFIIKRFPENDLTLVQSKRSFEDKELPKNFGKACLTFNREIIGE